MEGEVERGRGRERTVEPGFSSWLIDKSLIPLLNFWWKHP
jgi:hypothetical protein